jgi:hypothetical protein
MGFSRENSLDQALDIAGSLTQNQNMSESDESLGFGPLISGQVGAAASIVSFSVNTSVISGLTGMTNQSVGRFLTITGAATSGNNGTFLITAFNSINSVNIKNINGSAPDSNNGNLSWFERNPYSLEDDINYIRTDRRLIKGTTNWYDSIPLYQRPNSIGTNIATNLNNIANKTTDAVAYNVNRSFFGQSVSVGDIYTVISSVSNFKHSDSINTLGIPCFDKAPFIGDWTSCYVHIVDGYSTGNGLTVLSGLHIGERIFGITYDGYSVSPDSVTVKFYSAPFNIDYTISPNEYIWENNQSSIINLLYGFNERLDQLDFNAFRTIPVLGIVGSSNSGGTSLPKAKEVGQLLYAVEDDLNFIPAKPIVNDDGFILVNEDDIIVVVT